MYSNCEDNKRILIEITFVTKCIILNYQSHVCHSHIQEVNRRDVELSLKKTVMFYSNSSGNFSS